MSTFILQLFDILASIPLPSLPLLLFFIFFIYKLISTITTHHNTTSNSLPHPPKLPILGNLHQLGKYPHRSLQSLSERYGKLMLLHLGSRATLIVSCPKAAQEIMKTHDLIFANRPKLNFINIIFYEGKDVGFSRYGENWRHLKSIAMVKLLSNKKVQSFRAIREEEVALMVQNIKHSYSSSSSPINLSAIILKLTNDLVSRITLGRKYSGDHDKGTKFELLFKELTEVMVAVSVRDYIPWLGWIDRVTGLEGRAKKVRKEFDEFLKTVIQEHVDRLKNGESGDKVNDFLDILLQVQREDPTSLSADSIGALIMDIFAAATETTYTLLEWAVAGVLKHPRVMKKLQEEVRGIVKGKKGVTEDDLENMKYLKAIIKETLRLHPPAPMTNRESTQDVKISGYNITAGTQVIINVWAIQTDVACWEKPKEFNPERFLNSTVDFKGQHFQFIPFGAGRRGCPGPSYSMATVELVLATLFYEFDWKLPNGAACETLDMTERAGITIHRQHPLMVTATPHFFPQDHLMIVT